MCIITITILELWVWQSNFKFFVAMSCQCNGRRPCFRNIKGICLTCHLLVGVHKQLSLELLVWRQPTKEYIHFNQRVAQQEFKMSHKSKFYQRNVCVCWLFITRCAFPAIYLLFPPHDHFMKIRWKIPICWVRTVYVK